ncbi:MAG: acyl--CoA ligase [Pseudomonadales bacterium]|nr:acyl--CoA ligase [Pseudomonadales bacterium]
MELLIQRLKNTASSLPQSIVVIQNGETYTYSDLWYRVVTVADRLKCSGLQSGQTVAMLMENSIDYIASLYGIWAAGGVTVALNTALKYRDLNHLVIHCGAQFLLSDGVHPELKTFIKDGSDRSLELIDVASLVTSGQVQSEIAPIENHSEYELVDIAEDAVASIIYTSGTTGHPKGVTLRQSNLSANTHAILQSLNISQADRVMCVLPFFYSYGNSVLHTHLWAGASLVLENSFMYPQKVLESMQVNESTTFCGVPSTFNLLLNRASIANTALPHLTTVTQAGGAMSKASISEFKSAWPQADFYVMYGQTEASARITCLAPDMLDSKLGSVGLPIQGVELEIRGEDNRSVPAGEQGEICIQGPNVMAGYWYDPEETQSVLKDGWLYTGDVGYRDEDGYVFIVGRNREMIKTGAHRIAPQEIEELILEVSGIEECAVVGVPDDLLGQVLKAVVVLGQDEQVSKQIIMKYCKDNLPQYKMPKQLEFVEALPKTASGKIQKHKLV